MYMKYPQSKGFLNALQDLAQPFTQKETLYTTILPPSRFLDPPTIFNDLSLIIQHPLHFTAPYIGQSHLGYEWLPEVILVLDRDCWSQRDQEGHIMFPQVYKISNQVSKAALRLRFLLKDQFT